MNNFNEIYCYPDINRSALVVKYKKPFIDWLVYISKEYDGPEYEMRPEEVETDGFDSKTVFLIPAFEENDKFEKYLKKNCKDLFEHIVGDWYTDPEMWPKDRSWKVFKDWFEYEIHTMVFDMVLDEPLEHDE
jgi:hypothetical protein